MIIKSEKVKNHAIEACLNSLDMNKIGEILRLIKI